MAAPARVSVETSVVTGTGGEIRSTFINGEENRLTFDDGAPAMLVDILAAHDIDPLIGHVAPHYSLSAEGEVGSMTSFSDGWRYEEITCDLVLQGTPPPSLPVEEDGFAALVASDVPDGRITIHCADPSTGQHTLVGAAAFDEPRSLIHLSVRVVASRKSPPEPCWRGARGCTLRHGDALDRLE